MFPKSPKLAIIGLGYVGLPLALEFAKKYQVTGFDINATRIEALKAGHDITREAEPEELAQSKLQYSSQAEDIADCDIYIITVPTPIDNARRPDLRPLISASTQVGKLLKPGNIVIYESTVYPGCTEEDCIPILERESNLTCAIDNPVGRGHAPDAPGKAEGEPLPETVNRFFVGYSPERINPGDKHHRLPSIKKVTSGSTPEAAEYIDKLYASIITAGTHKVSCIKVAEAAKVIENTQRDVNIALINELAMLFAKLGIQTKEVLDAAATKWNFLPFQPGLVGGHCIGVDPYYLTHKAQQIGFHPQMILAGRRTNDGMGTFVAGELIKLMAQKGVYRPQARVLILGLTFKENCPDLRNTRVIDVITALHDYKLQVDIHDPWANPVEAKQEYGLEMTEQPEAGAYDAAILCVAHAEFASLGKSCIKQWMKNESVIFDLKSILPQALVDASL